MFFFFFGWKWRAWATPLFLNKGHITYHVPGAVTSLLWIFVNESSCLIEFLKTSTLTFSYDMSADSEWRDCQHGKSIHQAGSSKVKIFVLPNLDGHASLASRRTNASSSSKLVANSTTDDTCRVCMGYLLSISEEEKRRFTYCRRGDSSIWTSFTTVGMPYDITHYFYF